MFERLRPVIHNYTVGKNGRPRAGRDPPDGHRFGGVPVSRRLARTPRFLCVVSVVVPGTNVLTTLRYSPFPRHAESHGIFLDCPPLYRSIPPDNPLELRWARPGMLETRNVYASAALLDAVQPMSST